MPRSSVSAAAVDSARADLSTVTWISWRSSPQIRVRPLGLWTRKPPLAGAAKRMFSSASARSLQGMLSSSSRSSPESRQ
jgi:hypothetical protein